MEPTSLDIFKDRQQAPALGAGVSKDQQALASAFRSVAKARRVMSAGQALNSNEMATSADKIACGAQTR